MVNHYPTCLTIAGSDSSGGAGIQADLKTMSALGVYGMSVITAVTAQNTCGVTDIQAISPHIVKAQLEAVLSDISCDATKIGMLFSSHHIRAIIDILDKYSPRFIILDPVLVSTSGHRLYGEDNMVTTMKEMLFPRSTLITPNTDEASLLSGIPIDNESDMYRAGEVLLQYGCRAVLLKGGHLRQQEMCDILFTTDQTPHKFSAQKINTTNTHGTGCTLSSAIASYLALGRDIETAVSLAKKYVYDGLKSGADVTVGKGHGPINHFFAPVALCAHPTEISETLNLE